MRITKHGKAIGTLEEWLAAAGPKGKSAHWVDGRSAKECARAWLGTPGEMPAELAALLTHPDFGPLAISRIEPEAHLAFDAHAGPRNADIAVWAQDAAGPVAITLEAKVDEPFDQPVAKVLAAALERRIASPASGALPRIADLAAALFWPRQRGEPALGSLRYQLLTAAGGTLAMAQKSGANRAVVLIHELVSSHASRAKLTANANDLSAFVHRISRGAVRSVSKGVLYGPFAVPGHPLFTAPASLYVGKAVRELSEPTA